MAFNYDSDGLLTRTGALTLTRHNPHGMLTATTLGRAPAPTTYNGFGELSSTICSFSGSVRLVVDAATCEVMRRLDDNAFHRDRPLETV